MSAAGRPRPRGDRAHASRRPGLVVYRRLAPVDAIDEYSRRLVAALCEAGVSTHYVADGLASARRQVPDPRWMLIQYMPFSYGRWGVAPGLIGEAIGFRRRVGAPLAVSVHEAWVERDDPARARWRSTLMGAYQHAQLAALLQVADVVIAATQALVRKVGHAAIHVPVGSNITPVAISRDAARRRLGLDDELVVCLFGTGHPSRAMEYAVAAIDLLADARGPEAVKVLNLGVGAPRLDLAHDVAVDTPGHLDADALSVRLHASDLLILPFTDGVSTRRTTLMAGLAHGLPIMGLSGPATDDVLMDSEGALTLTALGDVPAFAGATLELANSPDRRRRGGESGRALYARHFDWPVAAERVHGALCDQGDGRRNTTQA